ncbi:MAG: helix-turn-helix domain-containing protein [Terrimicrobiaceae bacterium]
MAVATSKVTIHPPPGKPSWGGLGDLPLIYLGWGRRDFIKSPVPVHYDRGTHYYILVRGEILLAAGNKRQTVRGPTALLIDSDCPFGISQTRRGNVEILVWVWKERSGVPELRPAAGGYAVLGLRAPSLDSLDELHKRCRKEVSISDHCLPYSLPALRHLVEVEILRARGATPATRDLRWELAHAWMMNNLSIHTPVPALCDYLGMSPSALHRFFRQRADLPPGAYFRRLKWAEAKRLIGTEGWQVKAAAYHLGYKHPNDLSRATGGKSGSRTD